MNKNILKANRILYATPEKWYESKIIKALLINLLLEYAKEKWYDEGNFATYLEQCGYIIKMDKEHTKRYVDIYYKQEMSNRR